MDTILRFLFQFAYYRRSSTSCQAACCVPIYIKYKYIYYTLYVCTYRRTHDTNDTLLYSLNVKFHFDFNVFIILFFFYFTRKTHYYSSPAEARSI